MRGLLRTMVPGFVRQGRARLMAGSAETDLDPEIAALVSRGNTEELAACLERLEPANDFATRAAFLEIGRALLKNRRRLDLATKAFLQAYACDPIAKYEFGESILTFLNEKRPRNEELRALIDPICAHPDTPFAPDLAVGALTHLAASVESEDAAGTLLAVARCASAEQVSEAAKIAQEKGAYWAEALLMEEFMRRPGLAMHGMGPFLRLGAAYLKDGRLKEAASVYGAAQKLNPEAKQHFGAHIVAYVAMDKPGLGDIRAFVEEIHASAGQDDVLVPDARRELLEYAFTFDETAERTALTDKLARHLPQSILTKIGDQALGEGRNSTAICAYEHAIRKQPTDILLRLQLGITQFLDNNHKQAIAHFNVLGSLQAAEQERWGVTDLPVRVLHWTYVQAFGHITLLDTYIKALKLGWLPEKRSILAFDRTNPPAGWRLLQYFSKYLEIVGAAGDPAPVLDSMVFNDGPLADKRAAASKQPEKLPTPLSENQRDLRRLAITRFYWTLPTRDGGMTYISDYSSDVQRAWKAEGHGPLLSLENEERKRFRAVMRNTFGLPEDAWFVLLHVREASFKPGWDTRHAYTRNASIDDYRDAIDVIRERGGWVVRAGDPSMRPFSPNERVIDYATSPYRSPEIDVQLCAECRFFLGTNSGFSLAPPLFGRRCVLTNWSPLANPNWYPDDIFVPKLVRERKTGRFLTLEDMYASKAGWSQFARDFVDEWEKLDNDPADIVMAVEEMIAKLEGRWQDYGGDLDRQAAYEDIVRRYGGYLGSRFSDTFLRKNAWLLESEAVKEGRAEQYGAA